MPLAIGMVALEAALVKAYSDVGAEKPTDGFAKNIAQAINDFVLSAIPMTLIVTMPGSVAGAMTSGPVQGKGLGGLDKPVPGMGLDAAKALLEQSLVQIMTHGNASAPAAEKAKMKAKAIFDYFSQAIIMTEDKTSGPLPAPPPVGPVTGSIEGKGGVISSSPGGGYSSAKGKLESDLKAIWSQVSESKSVADQAAAEAKAIHDFCKEGKIETKGTFIAVAAVAPPPAPPMGAYLPGIGASIMGKIS